VYLLRNRENTGALSPRRDLLTSHRRESGCCPALFAVIQNGELSGKELPVSAPVLPPPGHCSGWQCRGGAREWSTPGGCSDTRARRWPKSLAGGRGHVGKPTAARGTAGEGEAARFPHWVFVEACTAVTDMPRRCGRARRREWVREPKLASHASLLTLLGAMSVHTPAERTLEGTSASTSIARCFALAEASPYSRTIAARGCFPLS
jgi:hypothetical protein